MISQCIPAACSPYLWKTILNGIFKGVFIESKVQFDLCQTSDRPIISKDDQTVLYV